MTQQTINGTVYRVGQELYIDNPKLLPDGVHLEIIHNKQSTPYCKILALPNPDPLAVKPTPLTREELITLKTVWYKEHDGEYCLSSRYTYRAALHALGIPMFRTKAECRLYHEMGTNND